MNPTDTTENKEIQAVMAHSSLLLDKEDHYLNSEDVLSKMVQKQGLYRLAKVYYDKSDLDKAEKYFIKAASLADIPKDAFALFKIYGFLIRIYSERLEPVKAENVIKSCEDLIEKLADSLGSLNAEYFYNLGVIQNYRGQFMDARESFLLAYIKSQEENDSEVLAKSLHSLASSHLHNKDYSLSLSYLGQLEEVLKILRKQYIAGSMNHLYGNIFLELGEYEKALHFFQKANRALMTKTSWNMLSYILLGQGIAYKKMGDYKKAILVFELAQDITYSSSFKRLSSLLQSEIQDVNDSSVDLYLDRNNRVVYEKAMGPIDFKHRFVLLEILFLLAQNPGRYYDKEGLAKSIWKDEYNPLIHDKLIYTSVSRLRKLIEPKDGKRKYIIRGKDGYTFNPRIKTRFHREHIKHGVSSIANVELSSPV